METNKIGSNIGTGTEPKTQKPTNSKIQEAVNSVKESSAFLGTPAQLIIADLIKHILQEQEKDVITNYSEQIEQKQTLKEALDKAIDAYEDLIGERDRAWVEKGKELTPTKKELTNIIFKTMNIMKTMGLDIQTVLQDELTALQSKPNTEHHPTPKTLQKGE